MTPNEWSQLSDAQHRVILDKYLDTKDIRSDEHWDYLPWWLRKNIVNRESSPNNA